MHKYMITVFKTRYSQLKTVEQPFYDLHPLFKTEETKKVQNIESDIVLVSGKLRVVPQLRQAD